MEKVTINGLTLSVSDTVERVINHSGDSWSLIKATSNPDVVLVELYKDYQFYGRDFIDREEL